MLAQRFYRIELFFYLFQGDTMASVQPQTIAESLFERIEDARYMKRLPPLFANALFKDINKLKRLVPDIALSMEGNVYAFLNQEDKSINAYKDVIEINPSALNIYNLGFTYEIFNRFELALDFYRQSFKKAMSGDIKVLNALANRFINFFSYKDLIEIKKELDKYQSNPDIEIVLKLRSLFKNDELMFDFGCQLNTIVNEYISARFIFGTIFREVDGRLHIVYCMKFTDDSDIDTVCECNEKLSAFITDFIIEHQVDFDNVSVYCEVVE